MSRRRVDGKNVTSKPLFSGQGHSLRAMAASQIQRPSYGAAAAMLQHQSSFILARYAHFVYRDLMQLFDGLGDRVLPTRLTSRQVAACDYLFLMRSVDDPVKLAALWLLVEGVGSATVQTRRKKWAAALGEAMTAQHAAGDCWKPAGRFPFAILFEAFAAEVDVDIVLPHSVYGTFYALQRDIRSQGLEKFRWFLIDHAAARGSGLG